MRYPFIVILIVQLTLIALRLTNVIDWSWSLVMIPAYSLIALYTLLAAIVVFMKLK